MTSLLSCSYREEVEAILSLAPLAIAVIEMPSQKYVLANENYCKVLRTPLKPNELLGRTISEILCSPNPEALSSLHRAHVQGEATKFGTLVSNSVGEDTTYWTGAAVPISRNGDKTLVLGLLAEVTSQVIAKQEAESKTRELELEKQRIDEFLAMAVHELRTPLTTLKIWTQFLLAKQGSSDFANTLRLIDQQSTRMVRLINDLLNSTKASSGNLDLQMDSVSVSSFMEDLAQATPSFTNAGRVDFLSDSEKRDVFVKADQERLRQVILNLVHNAVLHSETQEPVQLRCSHSGESVRLEVVDQGKGIPSEDLERIFERFYRRPSSKRTSGLGLGLYLSRQLIKGMGGRIWAESEGLNRGSKFVVELNRV